MKKKKIISYILWSLPVLIAVVIFAIAGQSFQSEKGTTFGFTFSTLYAEELGLDWQETFTATLDDLGVRLYRIPVYWNRVERERGEFDWYEIDWMLDEAAKRDAEVILAVGRRLPRWPECHDPIWLGEIESSEVFEQELFDYIDATIERYQTHDAIVAWQIENEPFLGVFGECPPLDEELLLKEIDFVQERVSLPIMITESGELSSWRHGAKIADIVGVSMYENTWNPFWGYFNYPLPPAFYHYKASHVEKAFPGTMVISSELQTEPWTPVPMTSFPLNQQFESIDLEKIQQNVAFARDTGFDTVLMWGVEWWYWLKEVHNMPAIWEYGKTLFK
ncbi:MAG: beta-galactosidase [Patescibacteria group bacterium]